MAVIENDYAAYIQTPQGEYPLRDIGAVRTDQGTENAGKVLGIGSDGMVTPVEGNSGGGTVTPEQIQAAVDQYLEENPVSADLPQVDHGTADTTFTLPANEIHTWGEVASLTLTLGAETSGVANGYWFSFDSGDTATTLSLPETVQTDIVVEPNTHYECMIVNDYMTFYDWEVSA